MAPRRERQAGGGGTQGGGGPALSALHRHAFVQHLMAKGCVRESVAREVFEQLTCSSSAEAFQGMVAEQNAAMQTLSFQIRTLRHPMDGHTYVAFINTMVDEPSTKHATHYSHGQREFFKHVLAAIAADPRAQDGVGSASSIELLNLDLSRPVGAAAAAAAAGGTQADAAAAAAAAAAKLTKTQKDDTLRQLVDELWLQHSAAHVGHYCIGPRSFLELSDLLLSFDVPDATREAWAAFL